MDWKSLINGFKTYLRLEKSLSENSIDAYLRDIERLVSYFPDSSPQQITEKELRHFLVEIAELGIQPRSQARIISGIRSFYKYLLYEEIITADPTTLIDLPKIGRKLPEVLSIAEIDAIIEQIDLSLPEGHRNKAMLETLYSCGLRVSELIAIQISNLYFHEGFIKVLGKGDKERLVPIGSKAIKEIEIYVQTKRCHLKINKGHEDFLFLNRWGRQLTRVMIFTIIKQLTSKAGITKKISPHTFRHSFATHLVEGGADLRAVQEMLGHQSITTTEIYAHLDKKHLHSAIIDFHPRS